MVVERGPCDADQWDHVRVEGSLLAFERMSVTTGKHRHIGLDMSLRATGVAWWDFDDPLEVKSAVLKPAVTGAQRLWWYWQMLQELITRNSRVVVEGYAYGTDKATALGELGGVLRLVMAKRGLKEGEGYFAIPPPTLKKYVTGSGKAQKAEMMLHAYKRWNVSFNDDNACDAYACLMVGNPYLDGTKVQAEITRKLLAPAQPKAKKARKAK